MSISPTNGTVVYNSTDLLKHVLHDYLFHLVKKGHFYVFLKGNNVRRLLLDKFVKVPRCLDVDLR